VKKVNQRVFLACFASLPYTMLMVKKTVKKTAATSKKSTKVDNFEPNKMGFAVALLAAVSLVVLGLIAMYA
jgi:hypothetical protein